MINRAIAPRYAKVLFDIDCRKGSLQERIKDFEFMVKTFKDHPKLINFLKAPQISLKEKKKLIHDTFNGIFDQTFMNFIFYLIQKSRLINLGHIASAYRFMVNEYLGLWEAEIVTAMPLDVDSETKLKQKLEKDFQKKIILDKHVDPRIIGGAVLIIANEMLDWSVTGRLRKLKENLITGAQ